MAHAVQERDRGLREALDQKAVLIREIHHRVKNNLQIVMSLLSLQSSRLTDRTARGAIEQARTRVNALALVHRMIYELDRDGIVDLKPLLGEVAAQLQQGLSSDHRNVRLRVSVPHYNTDGDTAIPLTLFAIEALTNAYKHGFPEAGDSGTISLSIEHAPDGRLELIVADSGRGVALSDTNEPAEQSTGTRLMAALAHQVGGEVLTRRGTDGGTVVELRFPDRNAQAPPRGPEPASAPAPPQNARAVRPFDRTALEPSHGDDVAQPTAGGRRSTG
jgi:two-component sensor histidine kinase